ncbi:MAG: hypothetical protein UZ13_02894, partial [Chloroflexi bacterium OLB13]
ASGVCLAGAAISGCVVPALLNSSDRCFLIAVFCGREAPPLCPLWPLWFSRFCPSLVTPSNPHPRPLSLRERGEGRACVRWECERLAVCSRLLCVLCGSVGLFFTHHSSLRATLTPGPSPSGRGEKDVRAVECEGSSVCSNALCLIGSFVAHSVAEPIHSRRPNSLFSRL